MGFCISSVIVYMRLCGMTASHAACVCVCVFILLCFFCFFYEKKGRKKSAIVCFLSTSCPNTLNTTTDGCVSSER